MTNQLREKFSAYFISFRPSRSEAKPIGRPSGATFIFPEVRSIFGLFSKPNFRNRPSRRGEANKIMSRRMSGQPLLF